MKNFIEDYKDCLHELIDLINTGPVSCDVQRKMVYLRYSEIKI